MMRSIKCIVTGDRQSGKTCLLMAHMQKKFPTEYIPCQYDNAVSEVVVDDKAYALGLWDTFFQMEDCALRLRPLMYPQTDVFLICFSIVEPDSLSNVIEIWSKDVNMARLKDVPVSESL